MEVQQLTHTAARSPTGLHLIPPCIAFMWCCHASLTLQSKASLSPPYSPAQSAAGSSAMTNTESSAGLTGTVTYKQQSLVHRHVQTNCKMHVTSSQRANGLEGHAHSCHSRYTPQHGSACDIVLKHKQESLSCQLRRSPAACTVCKQYNNPS